MLVTLKINGQEIHADTDKFHESWIAKCLAYGVRRLPNDSFSGEKGELKYDRVKLLIADMESGKEAPVRVSSGKSSVDPVTALARKTAKATLTNMFKAITKAGKALDFAKHEKCAPFFTIKELEDKTTVAVWKEETVTAWMTKQKDSGKIDFMADAKAYIEATKAVADDMEDELDF